MLGRHPTQPKLFRCGECGRWTGIVNRRLLTSHQKTERDDFTSALCLCDGPLCSCGEHHIHRPISNYYDESDDSIWHVSYLEGMRRCPHGEQAPDTARPTSAAPTPPAGEVVSVADGEAGSWLLAQVCWGRAPINNARQAAAAFVGGRRRECREWCDRSGKSRSEEVSIELGRLPTWMYPPLPPGTRVKAKPIAVRAYWENVLTKHQRELALRDFRQMLAEEES